MPAHGGERTLFCIFYPCSKFADGHMVFRLARRRTRVASDTFALIDEEGVVRHRRRIAKCYGGQIVIITPFEKAIPSGSALSNASVWPKPTNPMSAGFGGIWIVSVATSLTTGTKSPIAN